MSPALLQPQLQLPYRRGTWIPILQELLPDIEIFAQPADFPLISERDRAIASAGRQFGVATLRDGKRIAFYEIDVVSSGVDLLRNRVGLRQLIARCIDQVNAHGVLAFFVQPGTGAYRLTYAARESTLDLATLAVQTSETATRRFTYVLGPGDTRRTAALRLAGLSQRHPEISLAHVTDAFSVEKLNDEFFEIYKEHYRTFCRHLLESDAPARVFGLMLDGLEGKALDRARKPVRDFVKKLLGRLIFLHFLQKKGWLGCDAARTDWHGGAPDFLRQLFDSTPAAEKHRFHSTRLVPLFFDTLNNPHRERDLFSVTGSRVPYLNGGLFERDFTGVEQLDFPAPLFAALLEFFGQYHFTIDENDPEDHEIGIDPEMLGHIFENLLEDNKDKGAYYTPKAVVQYMCQQSLIHALAGHFPDDSEARSEIERLIRTKEPIDARDAQSWLSRHATQLATRLDDLRICDPAIGSGAFPIGLLQEIYWTKLALNSSLDRARAKRDIIQRSIHGVDLDAGAVEIARLRCWLALIVEENVPVPLPNLDYQIMQGNSLLESFEGIDLSKLDAGVRFGHTVSAVLGDPQGQFLAEEARSQLELGNAARRDEISTLLRGYFGIHRPEDKASTRARIDALAVEHIRYNLGYTRDVLETHLQQQRETLAGLRVRPPRWREAACQRSIVSLQEELAELIAKETRLRALEHKPERPFFLWHLWFRHVLAVSPEGRDGFDIVIGNPPYVRADNPDFLPQRIAIFAERRGGEPAFKTLWEKWDLYVPFIEQGHALLRPGGVETMIVSDAYCHSKYAIKSQDWFIENAIVHRLDFLGKLQIFDAGVKNMIFFYGRGDGAANIPQRRVHTERFGNVTMLPSKAQALATHRLFFPESDYEEFGNFTVETVSIEEICYISVGMVAHAHEEIARGEFELRDLVSAVRDTTHTKPFVEAKHLARWRAATHRWFEWGTRRSPAMLRRQTFPELYEAKEKLISVDMAAGVDSLTVVYDDAQLFHNHSAWSFVPWHYLKGVRNRSLKKSARYVDEAKPGNGLPDRHGLEKLSKDFDAKYLVAVMNSKVARRYLMNHRRSNIHLFPDDWKSLQIPVISLAEQALFVAPVDRILAAKRAGDEATVAELEAEIDSHVFRLYGLKYRETLTLREIQQPTFPLEPRVAYAGVTYFETLLPHLLRLAPEGLPIERVFHAMRILTSAKLRRAEGTRHLEEAGERWVNAFQESYKWEDAAAGLTAEVIRQRIRGVGRLHLAPNAEVVPGHAWLEVDAWMALHLSLAAEPAMVESTEAAHPKLKAEIQRLTQAA